MCLNVVSYLVSFVSYFVSKLVYLSFDVCGAAQTDQVTTSKYRETRYINVPLRCFDVIRDRSVQRSRKSSVVGVLMYV